MKTNSKKQLIKKLEMINILSGVKRYSRDFLIRPEPLISHIGFCSIYAVMLYSELKTKYPKMDLTLGTLVTKATIHDLDEVATGDIVRNVKHHSPESVAMFDVLEDNGMRYIDKYLENDVRYRLFDKWKNAKDPTTIEGVLVKVIDFLAVIYKVWDEYYLLGNKQFSRVTNELLNTLKAKSFDKLCSKLRVGNDIDQYEADDVNNLKSFLKALSKSCVEVLEQVSKGDDSQLREHFNFLEICNDSKAI